MLILILEKIGLFEKTNKKHNPKLIQSCPPIIEIIWLELSLHQSIFLHAPKLGTRLLASALDETYNNI